MRPLNCVLCDNCVFSYRCVRSCKCSGVVNYLREGCSRGGWGACGTMQVLSLCLVYRVTLFTSFMLSVVTLFVMCDSTGRLPIFK